MYNIIALIFAIALMVVAGATTVAPVVHHVDSAFAQLSHTR